ncbi:MAG: diacylglycerol kinase family protein [Bacteroidetes bacterium]|nr:diacylglycerol kinase family protein [Bacteroidota bacterium]
MESQKISINKQMKGFGYAFAGIEKFILSERNALIHLGATIAVFMAALIFGVSIGEGIALTIAIGLVWMAEMFNTCIEKIMNFISTEERPEIAFIKDVSAGAVLVASATAFVIGLLIFIPKIL